MKWILLLIGVIINVNLKAQVITFNKRVQYGCANTICTGVEITDTCFYVTGIALDSFSCKDGVFFAKIDTLGAMNLLRVWIDSVGKYGTWHPSLHSYDNNNLVVSSHYIDSNNHVLGGVLKYTTNGIVNWISMHDNPYAVGGFLRPDDLQITEDSGYIITSSINDLQGVSDVGILRLDSSGNELWHQTRGQSNYVEHTSCIYVNDDGNFVIGYQQDNLSGVPMNYTVRSILEGLDSAGNTLWTYQSPSNQQIYGVNDFTKTKDAGWVIATGWGSERLSSSGNYSLPIQEAYVYKLDSLRNFQWGTKFHSDALTNANFVRIIELEDSSLIVFGTVVRLYPQPNPTYNVTHGRIVKLSPHGDSIWSREYEYLTTAGAKHTIYDAEQTHDGGFLICGEANGVGSGIAQQGWLLKLDEYGCLVPGCHLVASGNAIPEEKVQVSLYPNPTVDYLNLHYKNIELGEVLTFQVLDVQGRLQRVYNTADVSNKSYLLPVYDLATGIYIIELLQDGKRIYADRFVKE